MIAETAKAAGIPVEDVDASAFGGMDAVGKTAAAIAVVMSVVDVVLNIVDIVDVVRQCSTMCDQLDSTVRANYLSYFNGMRAASLAYKAAISPPADLSGLYNTSVFYGNQWWSESHPVSIQGSVVTISGVVVSDPQLNQNSLAFSNQTNTSRAAKPQSGQLTFDDGSCTGWCQFPGEGPINWRGTLIPA